MNQRRVLKGKWGLLFVLLFFGCFFILFIFCGVLQRLTFEGFIVFIFFVQLSPYPHQITHPT